MVDKAFIINKDLGQGRYCFTTLSGNALKQTIHCARLKLLLEPVTDKDTNSSVVTESSAKITYMGDEDGSVNKVTLVPMKKTLVMVKVN